MGSQRYKEQLDWDSESLTRLTLPVRAVSYSPSGLQLVVAGDDGVVKYMTGKTVPPSRLLDLDMRTFAIRTHVNMLGKAVTQAAENFDVGD